MVKLSYLIFFFVCISCNPVVLTTDNPTTQDSKTSSSSSSNTVATTTTTTSTTNSSTTSSSSTSSSGTSTTGNSSSTSTGSSTSSSTSSSASTSSNSAYPFYFPVSDLKAPTDIRRISCANSNAAGELRDVNNVLVAQSNADLYTGIEFIYEAPCTYKNMGPAGIRNWKWSNGSQVIHRTSTRGSKATFTSDNPWLNLRFNPGETQGRFHAEVIDLELKFTGNNQMMGSLHFEVYPSASSGQLATLVVRDSVIEGGKNALFIPSGASMTYIENTKIGKNVGNNIDQEHVTYINGVISTHFKNVSFYGSKASGGVGGHILKNKAAIRILESVTLDNSKGVADNSVMPLGDFSSFGYTWSENLILLRRKAAVGTMRDSVIDMREDRYFEPGGLVNLPFFDARGAAMPAMPPGCSNVLDSVNDSYWHVFNDTVLDSQITDSSVFRHNGIAASDYSGIFPTSSYEDIVANPKRQRSFLLTNRTLHSALKTTADGYFYSKPSYPTYYCENARLGTNLAAITSSREKFIQYALGRMRALNPKLPQLPGVP